MAIDLTPAADGTLRLLGNKQYIYNSAATRWERVIPVVPNATIISDYDGKSDGAQVYAGQQVKMSIKWNQNVSSSLFNQSMLTTTGTGTTIQNFAQDSVDPSLYTFNFSFTGPLGQITIPANSVSVFTNTNNSVIFSEAIPGAYLPYASMSIISKINTQTYTPISIFSFIDPNFKNVLRYFTTGLIFTTSSTNDTNSLQYKNSRIKVSFINTSNVANSGTGGFTSGDIVRKTGPYFTTPPLTGTTLYSSNINFISATATSNTRYLEMYYSSVPSGNYIGSYSIAAAAYLDNNQNNIAISPIYFGRFSTNPTLNTAIQFVRTTGTSNGVIKVYLDHFASLVSNVDQSKIVLSASTANGTSLTPLTLLKDTTVDANAIYGNMYTANYTVPPGTTDVTDVITLNTGTFTIPTANASNINGISYYSIDPPDSSAPWSLPKTSTSNSITIISPRSPVTITAVTPANNATEVSSSVLTYSVSGAPRTVSANNSLGDFAFKLYADAAKTTLLTMFTPLLSGTSITATVPQVLLYANTNYYPSFVKNAYKDDYGNYNLENNFIFTTLDPGPFTYTDSNPSNGSTGFGANSAIVINLNRNPLYTNTTFNWTIYTGGFGGTVFSTGTVPNYSSNVSISSYGTMQPLTTYYLSIPAGAYEDSLHVKSNVFNSIFTTVAATAANDRVFLEGTPEAETNYDFTVPAFIYSISAVTIGRGADAIMTDNDGGDPAAPLNNYGAPGGGGGALAYKNNISVTPGETLRISLNKYEMTGAQTRITRVSTGEVLLYARNGIGGVVVNSNLATGGSGGINPLTNGFGGGNGGAGGDMSQRSVTGGSGGGAAGTYYGTGGKGGDGVVSGPGNSGTSGANNSIGGTGAAFTQQAQNGSGSGLYGPNSPNKIYGGGAGGYYNDNNAGGPPAVRILWGDGRAFPNTNISTSSS